jgi:adenylate kinase family enzyme
MAQTKVNVNAITSKFFENKQPNYPYFIITYGPPGSGKSTVLKNLFNKLDIKQKNTINILVDEIVENIEEYKIESKKINNSKKITKENKNKL